MKKIIYLSAAISIFGILACKQIKNKNMMVVKDCTGTYLRFEGKDYHVCNLEMTVAYADSAQVTATFKKINECNGSAKDSIVCAMAHANEGWITVEKIE